MLVLSRALKTVLGKQESDLYDTLDLWRDQDNLKCYAAISFRVLHGVKIFDGLHLDVICVFALQEPIVIPLTGLLVR